MSDPYLGEIRLMAFTFPPRGWAQCNGQVMQINVNQALFSLLGTTYGGDGRTTFALPDLRGRSPLHRSTAHPIGEVGGEPTHTLTTAETPAHTHVLAATVDAATTGLSGPGVGPATSVGGPAYASVDSLVPMDPAALSTTGGSQAHENQQPYLTLEFCIAVTTGIYPSRN